MERLAGEFNANFVHLAKCDGMLPVITFGFVPAFSRSPNVPIEISSTTNRSISSCLVEVPLFKIGMNLPVVALVWESIYLSKDGLDT